MKKTLVSLAALCVATGAASAQEVTVMSWGGAYGNSHLEAYIKPFEAETGIPTKMVDADNPATPIKAQVEAGNVNVDVASVEIADAIRLCDEGLLEELDPSTLPDAPDGTAAADDFIEGTISDCMIPTDVFATVYAYDTTVYPDNPPTTMADFFDLEKFPGKRGLKRGAKTTLEMALLADGVAPADVYSTLETDEGVQRAFDKLDTIKDQVVWWEAGAQPPQLLADGEVVMTQAWNGRIFNAMMAEDKPFKIVWDGQVFEWEGFVIPKGAPHLEDAKKFIAFATSTEPQAKAASYISYGPPRASAAAIVGNIEGTDQPMGPNLPTSEENMGNALASDLDFWVDYDTELNERFSAWLAQ